MPLKTKEQREQDKEKELAKVHYDQAGFEDLPNELIYDILKLAGPPFRSLRRVCRRWEANVAYLIEKQEKEFELAVQDDLNLQWTAVPFHNHDKFRAPYAEVRRYAKNLVFHRSVLYLFSEKYDTACRRIVKKLFRFDAESKVWLNPVSVRDKNAPSDVGFMFVWNDNVVCLPRCVPPCCKLWLAKTNEVFIFNTNTSQWSQKHCVSSPGSIKGFGATLHGDRLIVYGGFQTKHAISNAIWCLDMKEYKWEKIKVFGKTPKPRHSHLQFAIDEYHLVVIGGLSYNVTYNDAWLLDMKQVPWLWKELKVQNDLCQINDFRKNAVCKVGDKLLVFEHMSVFSDFSNVMGAKLDENKLDITSNLETIPENLMNLRSIFNSTRPPDDTKPSSMMTLFVCDLKNVLNPMYPEINWNLFKNISLFPGSRSMNLITYAANAEGKIILVGRQNQAGEENTGIHILEPHAS